MVCVSCSAPAARPCGHLILLRGKRIACSRASCLSDGVAPHAFWLAFHGPVYLFRSVLIFARIALAASSTLFAPEYAALNSRFTSSLLVATRIGDMTYV